MDRNKKILLVTSRGLTEEQTKPIADDLKGKPVALHLVPDSIDKLAEAVPGAHALINCPRALMSERILDLAVETLEWIHVGGAGCEEFIFPRLVNSPIVLTNGRIIQGPEVADHALALLLALARNLHMSIKGLPAASRPIELRGKVACVIGLGGIGLLVAERLKGCGMSVFGLNHGPIPMVSFVDEVFSPEQRLAVLPRADVVVMAAPYTAATDKFMGSAEFDAVKSGAIYINVSRGKTTDTEALLKALVSGKLWGAGLDVTDPEPLAESHPLRKVQNVIITPHQAGLSDFNRQRSFDLIRTNIARFAEGRALYNVVDKRLGF